VPLHRDTLIAGQYFAAVAGAAAMRHCLTRPSSVMGRLDDVRRVTATLDQFPNDLAIPVAEYDLDEGYAAWAPRYDEPNPAVETSRAVMAAMLVDAPPGVALDAACGTGGQAEQLASLGYEVIGVDGSDEMLDVARAKVPAATFRRGDLDALPLDDASVDVVTCSLALTHVTELGPAIADFARVLRPGGCVILADIHPLAVTFGAAAAIFPTGEEGLQFAYVRNHLHQVADYVTAAIAAGLTVADCREPIYPESAITGNPAYAVVPDAVRQTYEGLPFVLAWRLVKPV
jgi:ubiquinone/menaquinone biosynthesis C-methylase UbiE